MAPSGVTFGLVLAAVGLPGALWAGPGRPKGRQSPEKKRQKSVPKATGNPHRGRRMLIRPHQGQKCIRMGAWVGAWVPKWLQNLNISIPLVSLCLRFCFCLRFVFLFLRHAYRQTDKQTDRQTDRQLDRQETDRHTNKQTDRQSWVGTCPVRVGFFCRFITVPWLFLPDV